MHKAYTILMSLELGSIGIKYQGLNTNPFQQSSPIMLIFLISMICHAVASTGNMNLTNTIFIFHLSGVVGCETLLWILLPHFWNCCIINLFLLLVTSICFFNCIDNITKLLLATTHSNATTQAPNLEQEEPHV